MMNNMSKRTTLGLDERLERILTYVFGGLSIVLLFNIGWIFALILGWIPALVLYFVEKNRMVRWHAAQSIITFGSLSLVMTVVSLLKGLLNNIAILNVLTNAGLGLLLSGLSWVAIILWVGLAIIVWFQPNFRLPFISKYADMMA